MVPTRDPWLTAAEQMRARGMRWTPQRRLVITSWRDRGPRRSIRCDRAVPAADPMTTPSTVYRTLDVLEDLGLIQHGHGADGREEYHVLPESEHGHRYCTSCGRSWEIDATEAAELHARDARPAGLRGRPVHLTIVRPVPGVRRRLVVQFSTPLTRSRHARMATLRR